jgi:UDP-N-acetylmuramyl pentapeptide phosphotransferase/UDP-N-acetylglucosamine-1-phosphate transferase
MTVGVGESFVYSRNAVGFVISPVAAGLMTAGLLALLLRRKDRLPLDSPNHRSLHTVPVPRIGGLAIFPSLLLVTYFGRRSLSLDLGLAAVLAGFSFLDDRFGLPVVVRLPVHAIVCGIFLFFVVPHLGFWFFPLGLLALVWGTNLFNFMDGFDGLAGGMTFFGFAFYGALAWMGGDATFAARCFAVSGAAVGFLVFNVHPARVFLGDAGSIPLGFLAGALGVEGWRRGLWPFWVPPVVFAPFVIDATTTLGRRFLRGEPFWRAHRTHYYQRLVQMGWGHGKTSGVEYLLMMAFGSLALVLPRISPVARGVLGGGAAILTGALLWSVDRRWGRWGKKEEVSIASE